MEENAPAHQTIDGDEDLTSLVKLGLVEMVATDRGPRYRIVAELDALNALLRARQGY